MIEHNSFYFSLAHIMHGQDLWSIMEFSQLLLCAVVILCIFRFADGQLVFTVCRMLR